MRTLTPFSSVSPSSRAKRAPRRGASPRRPPRRSRGRLGEDQTPLLPVERKSRNHLRPGEVVRPPGEPGLQGRVHALEHRLEVCLADVAVSQGADAAREQHREPAERAVPCEARQVRLHAREPVREVLKLFRTHVEEGVLLEELVPGQVHFAEQLGRRLELRRQRSRGLLRLLLAPGVHEDDDVLVEVREGLLVFDLDDAVGQAGREERIFVRVHLQMGGRPRAREQRDHHGADDDLHRATPRAIDPAREESLEPNLDGSFHASSRWALGPRGCAGFGSARSAGVGPERVKSLADPNFGDGRLRPTEARSSRATSRSLWARLPALPRRTLRRPDFPRAGPREP